LQAGQQGEQLFHEHLGHHMHGANSINHTQSALVQSCKDCVTVVCTRGQSDTVCQTKLPHSQTDSLCDLTTTHRRTNSSQRAAPACYMLAGIPEQVLMLPHATQPVTVRTKSSASVHYKRVLVACGNGSNKVQRRTQQESIHIHQANDRQPSGALALTEPSHPCH
jgi:hypothetical protein